MIPTRKMSHLRESYRCGIRVRHAIYRQRESRNFWRRFWRIYYFGGLINGTPNLFMLFAMVRSEN